MSEFTPIDHLLEEFEYKHQYDFYQLIEGYHFYDDSNRKDGGFKIEVSHPWTHSTNPFKAWMAFLSRGSNPLRLNGYNYKKI